MEDRYPYIRFVVDAAPVISGAVAVILFLGGTMSACEYGGFAGFVSFIVTLTLTGVGYIAAMVWVESLRVFLDLESSTRDLLTTLRERPSRTSGKD